MVAAYLGGVLVGVAPCVYPMIPVVSRTLGTSFWALFLVALLIGAASGLMRYRRPLVPRDLQELMKRLWGIGGENGPREAGIGEPER